MWYRRRKHSEWRSKWRSSGNSNWIFSFEIDKWFSKTLNGSQFKDELREYTEFRNRYRGKNYWDIGFGAWSSRDETGIIVQESLEHYKTSVNDQKIFLSDGSSYLQKTYAHSMVYNRRT